MAAKSSLSPDGTDIISSGSSPNSASGSGLWAICRQRWLHDGEFACFRLGLLSLLQIDSVYLSRSSLHSSHAVLETSPPGLDSPTFVAELVTQRGECYGLPERSRRTTRREQQVSNPAAYQPRRRSREARVGGVTLAASATR